MSETDNELVNVAVTQYKQYVEHQVDALVAATTTFTNAVRVAVMTLRRKLGDPPIVHTVPRAGYRFGE